MTREEFDSLVESIGGSQPTTQATTTVQVQEVPIAEETPSPINDVEVPVPDEINPLLGVSRFSGASWFDDMQKAKVIIIGCGGIGSWAGLIASRFRPEDLILIDPDVVDPANTSGQLYQRYDAGKAKVEALGSQISSYSGVYSLNYREFVGENTFEDMATSRPIITICGFDNMEARKVAFREWKKVLAGSNMTNSCFIDARMSIDTCQIYSFTGDDDHAHAQYATHALFSDEEADATICSLKQSSYVAAITGGLIGNLMVQFMQSKIGIPMNYYTEYSADTMILKTQ